MGHGGRGRGVQATEMVDKMSLSPEQGEVWKKLIQVVMRIDTPEGVVKKQPKQQEKREKTLQQVALDKASEASRALGRMRKDRGTAARGQTSRVEPNIELAAVRSGFVFD